MTPGYPLPMRPELSRGRQTEGFLTPTQDRMPHVMHVPPKRVMPIVFLPGIMGSNLRLSAKRQKELHKDNNVAWRPDDLGLTNLHENATLSNRERQLSRDPKETEVDVYDPSGPASVSGDLRHSNVIIGGYLSPFLFDDPITMKGRLTAAQKARLRGWSEVFFGSYSALLQRLESSLNACFFNGKMNSAWHDVVDVDPSVWQLEAKYRGAVLPLTESELKRFATGCWYPVHAFGYNWLQSNGKCAIAIAARVEALIKFYTDNQFECTKVIVVTHSMGGLVGRALVHPDFGNLESKVAGIVHGVLPATGAAAAYKRIRSGFEDPGMISSDPAASGAAKVIGNYGDEVTAVLANSPGGLQLLPSEAYGNDWLQVTHNDKVLQSWPARGDPYEEIYKLPGRWYSLIREQWINPSGLSLQSGGSTLAQTHGYLDAAKAFHAKIASTYHPCTYAHYGFDPHRPSFGRVVWAISENCRDTSGWQSWPILHDSRQGHLVFKEWNLVSPDPAFAAGRPAGATSMPSISAHILPPVERGDQTVPSRSADHQLANAHVKAVFRQTGYEHQTSYQNDHAIASTLYSIVRIALQAQ